MIITIIVIVILAVAVILSIANNNPIENANKAKFQNDVKTMQEELELIKAKNYAETNGANYGTTEFTSLTGAGKYSGKFKVKDGKLAYTSKLTGNELTWAKEMGIQSSAQVLNSSEELSIKIEDGVFKTDWRNGMDIPSELEDEVIIPEGVTAISNYALYNCQNLTNITLPSTLKSIGDWCFVGCRITNITLPSSLESIGENAFNYTSLTEITIPASVTTVGKNALDSTYNLKTIILEKGSKFTEEEVRTWSMVFSDDLKIIKEK